MKENIEQQAEKYADSKEIRGSSYHSGLRIGYIEGAKFAHNAALSEAIEQLDKSGLGRFSMSTIRNLLEGLKK